MNSKKLIIGLDFGTTYTAVAYSESNNGVNEANNVQLYTAWPGMGNGDSQKVPSRIAYGDSPAQGVEWGYKIRPTTKARVHALMKLKLDEKLKKSRQLKLLLAFLSSQVDGLKLEDSDSDDDDDDGNQGPNGGSGKEPVDIVADYLSEVRKHFYHDLERQYGPALLASLRKELVVTVPAVWSERAKDLTLKAVGKAGFGADVTSLVTEPEAAAVYTLKGMTEGASKDDVKVGDYFVMCDAGGGTVDLISYKITQTSPIFKIEEAAVGTGDKCGATYVDKEFLSWLEKWIGHDAYKSIPVFKTRHGSQLMNAFEILKQHFSGDEDGLEIDLPKECGIDDDDDKAISGRTLSITQAQMTAVFDPCVNRILELIDEQVAAVIQRHNTKPKMLLVVGGFGRNEYLFRKITEYADKRSIIARKPQNPWSAIVRGAVCRGLEGPQSGLIAVRLARKHYGTYTSMPFVEGIHHPDDAYIDEFTGKKYARGQMTWLVDKGARLPDAIPRVASIEVGCKFKRHDSRDFGAVFVGCEEDIAPERYADKSAQNICKVLADLSVVPDHKFMKLRNGVNGEEYWMAEFRLEAKFMAGIITWSFIFDGQEYGNVSVSYND